MSVRESLSHARRWQAFPVVTGVSCGLSRGRLLTVTWEGPENWSVNTLDLITRWRKRERTFRNSLLTTSFFPSCCRSQGFPMLLWTTLRLLRVESVSAHCDVLFRYAQSFTPVSHVWWNQSDRSHSCWTNIQKLHLASGYLLHTSILQVQMIKYAIQYLHK